MIQGGAAKGYTIVETMIFLAVTAILFASAMVAIGGRQATVQFNQGVRDAQSKLQDVINQVSTGFYPDASNFTCSASATTATRPTFTATASKQGTSDSCTFLGKVVQFGLGTDQDGYNVISVASRRVTASSDGLTGLDVSSLAQALPTALSPIDASDVTTPDITQKLAFQYGVQATRVTVPDAGGSYASDDYGSVAFLSSFPGSNNGALVSGAQQVAFATVPHTTLTSTLFDTVTNINAMTDDVGPPLPSGFTKMSSNSAVNSALAHGVVICLADQGKNRRAMLTIGGATAQTSVKLDMGVTALCS